MLVNRVSAIVPTRNRSRQLRQALASIRALEGPDLEFELIVVDNGSTDDTEQVARAFGARFLRTPPTGAAAARNAGMRLVTTDYVAFLDDDDAWLPGHIRPHLELLQRREDLSAVVGQIVLTDNNLQNPGVPYPAQLADDGDLFAQFLAQIPQVGATVVRASVLTTVGEFDARCEGDEDWDWHLRLALRHRVGFVGVPCMLFRQRPIGLTADQHWLRLRNTRRVFWSNIRRARGRYQPGIPGALRLFLRHNGSFFAYFNAHAREEYAAGHYTATLRALVRAILCSPVHAAAHFLRPGLLRQAVCGGMGNSIT